MQPGEEVEVEASDAHDRIIGVFLVGDEEIGGGIPREDEAVVIGGNNGAEEFRGSGK